VKEITEICKAVSDKNRVRIVKMLEMRPLCVCEITAVLGLAPSTVSKHLSILKQAGLLFEQRENRWVNYHLNRATTKSCVRIMLNLLQTHCTEDPAIMKDRETVASIDRKDVCSR